MSFSRRVFPLAFLASALATARGVAQTAVRGSSSAGRDDGAPPGHPEPVRFPSRLEAAGARVPPAARRAGLWVAGFSQAGDGGAALYRPSDAAARSAAAFQSADGSWWELAEPFPNVKMFGARGDGVHDDAAALQAAIDSGFDVLFPAGEYLAGNLRQERDHQTLFGLGRVWIIKNADGPIITSSGQNVSMLNVGFRGDANRPRYSGDNIVSSGDHLRLINCGSRWASGRALRATGNACQVMGSCDVYETVDESPSGYDIELGLRGKATLYHQIYAIASGHAGGGIRLIDTGSHVISGGCQIGKLAIEGGERPAGVNGGMTANCRILGDVHIGISNAVFSGNQFGIMTVTIEKDVSNVTIDASNVFETGSAVVNHGNGNCLIERNTATGGLPRLSYGPDGEQVSLGFQGLPPLVTMSGGLRLGSRRPLLVQNAEGSGALNVHSANDLDAQFFGDGRSGMTSITSGRGGLYLGAEGSSQAQVTASYLRPQRDNALALGGPGHRWSTIHSATGVLQTSDFRWKTDVAPIADALLDAWAEVPKRQFRWKGAPHTLQVGVVAQDIIEVFGRHGLDPLSLGVVRHDRWEGCELFDNCEFDADGQAAIRSRAVGQGESYSVDYGQVATLDHALQSRRLDRLERALREAETTRSDSTAQTSSTT